jgi:hypothetical protein
LVACASIISPIVMMMMMMIIIIDPTAASVRLFIADFVPACSSGAPDR